MADNLAVTPFIATNKSMIASGGIVKSSQVKTGALMKTG
jgi:hypothetical protein